MGYGKLRNEAFNHRDKLTDFVNKTKVMVEGITAIDLSDGVIRSTLFYRCSESHQGTCAFCRKDDIALCDVIAEPTATSGSVEVTEFESLQKNRPLKVCASCYDQSKGAR